MSEHRTLTIALHRSARITPTWTTTWLAEAALLAGHRVWFLSPEDVEITRRDKLVARVSELDGPPPDRDVLAQRLVSGQVARRYVELGRSDVMLLRLNPLSPSALAMALMVREAGVSVVNDPAGLALTRSKAWLATLSDVPRPRSTVTRSEATARLFAAELDGPTVLKPAMASGGRGVQLVQRRRPEELGRAFHAARASGDGTVVVQEYLHDAEHGEKRLVWMDGELLGAYLRTRAEGEFRHNLRQGGQPVPTTIDAEDQRIAALLRPHLERNGIRIAGLDVIGGKVVEVNTLNPGGVHYASHLEPPEPAAEKAAGSIADRMVRRLAQAPQGAQPLRMEDVSTHSG